MELSFAGTKALQRKQSTVDRRDRQYTENAAKDKDKVERVEDKYRNDETQTRMTNEAVNSKQRTLSRISPL
jgi:hypothetical protein